MNILLTPVGNMASPTIQNVLRKNFKGFTIFGLDSREYAHGLRFCDKWFITPSRDSKEYDTFIKKLLKEYHFDLIYPLSTHDVIYFSKLKSDLKAKGTVVVSSDLEIVETCKDKLKTYKKLDQMGLSTRYSPIKSKEELRDLVSETETLVIKDRFRSGAHGLIITSQNILNLEEKDRKWFIEKSKIFDALSGEELINKLAMSYLPGEETSIDILADSGKVLCELCRFKIIGSGGASVVSRSIIRSDLQKIGQMVARELNLSFINNIQLRKDSEGEYKILEINPRIPGGIALSIEAGCDLITNSIYLAQNLPLMGCKDTISGMVMSKYWTQIVFRGSDER
jgi:carbamoyl-phosphate synthase large subunit